MKFVLESDGTLKGTKLFLNDVEVQHLSEVDITINEAIESITFGQSRNIDKQMEEAGYIKTEKGDWVVPDERIN